MMQTRGLYQLFLQSLKQGPIVICSNDYRTDLSVVSKTPHTSLLYGL